MPPRQPRIEVPGATSAESETTDTTGTLTGDESGAAPDDAVAALQAQLDAANAQIAALTAANAAPKAGESIVTEPVTPRGRVALAMSEFATMTTAEVHAALEAGKISMRGRPSVLCRDGWYCDPSYR